MKIIDISVLVRPGMIVYEGDPDVKLERVSSIDAGDVANVSRLTAGVHSGTHVDAQVHFIDGASGADQLPLDVLVGPCAVIDATHITADIDKDTLATLAIPEGATRVIFKTPNSQLWSKASFDPGFIGLTGGAALALVKRGVRLVGIDYLSIAPKSDPASAHIALLSAGAVILEGLDLRAVTPGAYDLVCLPVKLDGSDGAPARAILIDRSGG